MNLGETIKEYRKQKKMTQKQLAEKSNIALMSIQRYERNERKPTVETLSKILSSLEVSETDFFNFTTFLYKDLIEKQSDKTDRIINFIEEYKNYTQSWIDEVNNIESKPNYLLNAILRYLENTEEYYTSLTIATTSKKHSELPYFTNTQIHDIVKKVSELVKYEIYKIENNIE